jgi:hypothetical protein
MEDPFVYMKTNRVFLKNMVSEIFEEESPKETKQSGQFKLEGKRK